MSLNELINWFPSGTAEGDRQILDKIFVYVEEFSKIISPPSGNPYLLIGDKGSGKSAIFDFSLRVLRDRGVPAILITPYDINTSLMNENSSMGDMVRYFHSVLLSSIACKLSEESTGWFDGDRATIYYEAVNSEKRSPDFIGKMGKFLSDASKPLTKIDWNSAFPHLTKVTRDELEAAIDRVLGKKGFHIFIDDTDQVSNPEKPGHLNRIWALLLAVRRLSSNVADVKAVISMRSEVWKRLQIDPVGQRDQIDHFRNLCVNMSASRVHVTNIIERRLAMAASALGKPGHLYDVFFEGQDARPPFGEDRRSWKDLIVVRSRERPRDAIQLVNSLAARAISSGKSLIDESIFQSVMPEHSDSISKLFAQEVALECPEAIDVLRSFAGVNYEAGSFTFTAEQAREHFKKVVFGRFGVTLYGVVLSRESDSSVFDIWRFLYTSGVLNARASDVNAKDGYRHLDPAKDSMLVSRPRWNDMQSVLWEINTVYRDFLISVEKENETKRGIAHKQLRGVKRPRR